ncbi:MAG: hypothetical protein MJZ61_06420, partial [Bacteroidales bacterium]|nr:hypothetical protein [Bacteroidales bacterium]
MDKHNLIGIGLIVAIFIGFSIWQRPSEEQIKQQQRYRDSVAMVHQRAAQAEREQQMMRDSIAKAESALATAEKKKKT